MDRALARNDHGKVDYTTYQKATDRFPEIPPDEFNRSLVLIQPNGTWSSQRTRYIAPWHIGVRENGWRGATIMSPGSRLFLKPAMA